MKATVTYVPGGGLIGLSESNHLTPMDWSNGTDKRAAASSPVEMVLMALGACSAVDVITIMEKARTPLETLRVEMSAERSEEHPRVFTRIHLEYIVKGKGVQPAALERAIKLSEEKYCSVSAMIHDIARISSSFRIETD